MFRVAIIVLLINAITCVHSQVTYVVDTDETGFAPSNGTLTLDMAIGYTNAGSGNDTISIRYSGTYMPSSTLVISNGVVIDGPGPVHFSLSGNGMSSGAVVNITSSAAVRIRHVRFEDASYGALQVSTGGMAVIESCVFEDNATNTNGGAILNNGNLQVNVSSFIDNSSSTSGGGLYSGSSGSLSVVNTTFYDNSSGANGAAIYTASPGAFIDFCTFVQNDANANGGGIYAASSTSLGHSIFEGNTAGSANKNVHEGGGGNVSSTGGNVMDNGENTGLINGLLSILTDDLIGSYNLYLGNLVTDGYGMKYIPITSASSAAIRRGGSPSYLTDIRRAPRILSDNATFPALLNVDFRADAGAVEYTPYTVVAATQFGTMIGQMNGASTSGPKYMDFNMSPVAVISSPGGYVINHSSRQLIIDGFTQTGSRVPGPASLSSPAVPGICLIEINGVSSAFTPTAFSVSGNSAHRISGLTIYRCGVGMNLMSDEVAVTGCHFSTDKDGITSSTYQINTAGIVVSNGTNTVIGGGKPFHRNVFGKNASSVAVSNNHVHVTGGNRVFVRGNFFGLDSDGDAVSFSGSTISTGVRVTGGTAGTMVIITHNVFGGLGNGVYMDVQRPAEIYGNFFGTNATGNVGRPISMSGVQLLNTFNANVSIGSTLSGIGNVFASCFNGTNNAAGLWISNANSVSVTNNYFGLARNGLSPLTNNYGIVLSNSDNIKIGHTVAGHANYFVRNDQAGIRIETLSGNNAINQAYFGIDTSGATLVGGKNEVAILIDNSNLNSIGDPGLPCIIANSNSHGIVMRNGAIGNSVRNTLIGVDGQGAISGNGGYGIVLNGAGNTIIGGSSAGTQCLIANNSSGGVHFFNGSTGNTLMNDTIRNNGGNGIDVMDATTTGNQFQSCHIFSNTLLGIDLSNNGNNLLAAPVILGATECGPAATVQISYTPATAGQFRIEFYRIPTGSEDPSGYGEGNTPVLLTPWTNFSGPTTMSFVVPGLSAGERVSCIITAQSSQETSEFSNWIAVSDPMTATLDNLTNVSCDGLSDGSINLSVTGGTPTITYQWYSGVTPLVNTEDIGALAAGLYKIVYQDITGCKDSSTYTITQPPVLTIGSVTTSDPLCAGSVDGQISLGSPTGGTAPYLFSIDGGVTTQASATFTGLPAGTYSNFVVVDANGCISTYPSVVLTDPPPITVSAGSDTTICGSIQLALSGSYTIAGGVVWSTSGSGTFSGINTTNAVYTPSTADIMAGTVVLTITTTGNGTCSAVSDVTTVTMETPPNAGIDDIVTICDSSTTYNLFGVLSGTPDAGGVWLNNSGTGNVSGNIWALSGASVGVYSFSYYVNGTLCPADTANVTVTVQADDPLFIFDDFCLGSLNNGYSEHTPGGTYTLASSPGTGTINPVTGEISSAVAGLYEVMYTTNATCPNSFIDSVYALDTPGVDMTNTIVADPSCHGSGDGSITVSVTGTADSYSIDGGLTFQGSNVFTGLPVTSYDLIVVYSATGCSSSSNPVNLFDPPVVTQTNVPVDPTCTDSVNGQIIVNSITGVSPYQLSINNGVSWISSGSSGHTFTGLPGGIYQILVEDANGCQSVLESVILNTPAPLTFNLVITDVCLPDSGFIEFTNVTGGTGAYAYSVDGGSTFQSSPNFSGLYPILYNLSFEDANGCRKDSAATVGINLPATPVITANNPYCEGIGSISATASGTIFWYANSTILGSGASLNLPGNVSNGDYIGAANYDGGCFSLPDSVQISIVQNDLSIAPPQSGLCPEQPVMLEAIGTGSVSWNMDGTVTDTSGGVATVVPPGDRYYYVLLNNNGCLFYDSIYVDVDENANCGFNVSNAFSPNGDGINETWIIPGVMDEINNNVSVFNRWGDLVISFQNYDNNTVVWDGSDKNGQPLTASTYFYVIEFQDSGDQYTGWVQITKD